MPVENVWTKAGRKARKMGWEQESHPFCLNKKRKKVLRKPYGFKGLRESGRGSYEPQKHEKE